MNDGIPKPLCSMSYITVDDAIQHIIDSGPGSLLAKIDIRSAFRLIPVHPSDRHLLAMLWEDGIYIDTCMLAIWVLLIAHTATVTKITRLDICRKLEMSSCKFVLFPPDRPNIYTMKFFLNKIILKPIKSHYVLSSKSIKSTCQG